MYPRSCKGKKMPIRVLVAEEDLHEHKVVHDILGVCFKEVRITRALNFDSFLTKVTRTKVPFDLILYDYHFDAHSGKNALLALLKEKPEFMKSVVILNGQAEEITQNPAFKNLPYILKPYSLDNFSEVVKRISQNHR
jgi:DNA-binding NtrC family response regulator